MEKFQIYVSDKMSIENLTQGVQPVMHKRSTSLHVSFTMPICYYTSGKRSNGKKTELSHLSHGILAYQTPNY